MRHRWGALILLLVGAGCGAGEPEIPATCNGSVELCERRYEQVAYPTTHNAMAAEEDGFDPANHYLGIEQQLAYGIRGLMLDTHLADDGTPSLCHGACLFGEMPLADGLEIIRRFLARHRGEVVTIILESYVEPATTVEVFDRVGLTELVHTQAVGEPWPTLRELIDGNRRLVVFTDDADGAAAAPWLMYVWDHAWETDFAARQISDFSCEDNRGDPSSPLFIFNHFLTRTIPVPEDADEVNANPLLIDRARECQRASGKLPNFVTVDFYSVGDLFEAVDRLNDSPEAAGDARRTRVR